MVCDGQAGEAWQTFSKLHDLNNALGGQLTEFVPEAQVQSDSMVSTGILRGREDSVGGAVGSPAEVGHLAWFLTNRPTLQPSPGSLQRVGRSFLASGHLQTLSLYHWIIKKCLWGISPHAVLQLINEGMMEGGVSLA